MSAAERTTKLLHALLVCRLALNVIAYTPRPELEVHDLTQLSQEPLGVGVIIPILQVGRLRLKEQAIHPSPRGGREWSPQDLITGSLTQTVLNCLCAD